MRRTATAAGLILAAILGPAAGAAPASHSAPILSAAGARIGQAEFAAGPTGVLIRIELSPRALAPGFHGLHLHEAADCSDAAAGFKASGAHLGHSAGGAHGLLNPKGPEAGDLPNLFAPDADGPIAAEFFSTSVALAATAPAGKAALLGPKGAALVIHAAPDDHSSQPIGGAGARIACAALKPQP